MRGEADAETSYPRDNVVSLTELVGYVKTRVSLEAPEAGWRSSITPQSRDLRSSDGEFFFLTNESKVAKLEKEGAEYQGRFEHGMPVVVMGATEEMPEATADTYGGRDAMVFDVIKDSDVAKDFEDFVGQFPDSAFAPYARNRIALLQQREPATPAPSVAVRIDPATEETGLSLRPEDRRVVQEALTALGFDTRGTDGIFGTNTRRAIIGWQRRRGDEPTGYLSAVQHRQLLAEAEPKLAALAAARQKPDPDAVAQERPQIAESERVQLIGMPSNDGWMVTFDIADRQVREIFYALDDEQTFVSTGFQSSRNPETGLPSPQQWIQLPGALGQKRDLSVKYNGASLWFERAPAHETRDRLWPGGDRQLHPLPLQPLQSRQRAGPDRRSGVGSGARPSGAAPGRDQRRGRYRDAGRPALSGLVAHWPVRRSRYH